VQGNSGMPCVGNAILALISGLIGWKHGFPGTETIWILRQELTSGLTVTLVAHTHRGEYSRQQTPCPQCDRCVPARAPVLGTVATMVGSVQLERPYFYCRSCRRGVPPIATSTAGAIRWAVVAWNRPLRFICHVRLKRSGAWWYEVNSNQMLALHCA
jgi:hypothetical protein